MKWWHVVVVVIIAAVVFLAVNHLFPAPRPDAVMLGAMREMEERMMARYDSLARSHKDTVIHIERQKEDVTQRADTAVALVRNTRDVDSLIALYWRHRADTRRR
jgi:ABC-type siderophore export system fused ATPase/permease subunit